MTARPLEPGMDLLYERSEMLTHGFQALVQALTGESHPIVLFVGANKEGHASIVLTNAGDINAACDALEGYLAAKRAGTLLEEKPA